MNRLSQIRFSHAVYYLNVLRLAEQRYLQGGASAIAAALAQFDQNWGQISYGQQWVVTHWENDKLAAELSSSYAGNSATLLHLRQPVNERLRWLADALRGARRLGDRQAEGTHLSNIGLAQTELGDCMLEFTANHK